MTISYNYHAIDSSTLTFGNIVTQSEHTVSAIQGQQKNLESCFHGSAADTGWTPKISQLMSLCSQYNDALTNLKNVVQQVGGKDGLMDVTDKAQAGRFLAMDI